jgi:hypothetical protein
MRTASKCVILIALLSQPAMAAEDHLNPEISPALDISLSRMELRFAEDFEPILTGDQEAWVIAGEGLSPPFVVGVKRRAGARFLFGGSKQIGASKGLVQCELPIGWAFADKIVRLWRKMLLQTAHDPKPVLGMDGETYHFAMRDGSNWMAGKTWSPQTPKLSRLTKIVGEMRQVCESGKPKGLPGLERDVDDLLMRR